MTAWTPVPKLSLKLNSPLFRHIPLEFGRECVDFRKLIEPAERAASVNQNAVAGVAGRVSLLRWNGRLADRCPNAFHQIDPLAHIAAGRYGPDDVEGVGDIDIVVDYHDKFSAPGTGAGAGGDQQCLFRV